MKKDSLQKVTIESLTSSVLEAARDKHAKDVVLFDYKGLSDLCACSVVCSAESSRQATTIAKGIEDSVKEQYGIRPVSKEGLQSGEWILIDYGSIMIHIFLPEIRDYYKIDQLSENAATYRPFHFESQPR